MNTVIRPLTPPTLSGTDAAAVPRYVMHVGQTRCEIRARTVAAIADVLGFEQEMEGQADGLVGESPDSDTVADLLDSRMIAPPRPLRRRQRSVSSRALFYGVAGGG
ncbi:MAG: hypothetical protein EBX36_01680 [Planctomycetia bacterium]|nr:hypothetical protein [Planctomycetia bacterium]